MPLALIPVSRVRLVARLSLIAMLFLLMTGIQSTCMAGIFSILLVTKLGSLRVSRALLDALLRRLFDIRVAFLLSLVPVHLSGHQRSLILLLSARAKGQLRTMFHDCTSLLLKLEVV
jgi:hypothetical protein